MRSHLPLKELHHSVHDRIADQRRFAIRAQHHVARLNHRPRLHASEVSIQSKDKGPDAVRCGETRSEKEECREKEGQIISSRATGAR
jgi:hypothetical protein